MKFTILTIALFVYGLSYGQYEYNEVIKSKNFPTYDVGISELPRIKEGKRPQSIILLIGDGMGLAQIHAGMTVNKGQLFLRHFKNIGFSLTHASDNYITDSAAGGTALSTGHKTNNRMIAMSPDSLPLKTILEIAEELGKSTGLVSTSSVTHATPASFIAHQPSRNMYEAIALDFLNTDIDVFIGGGLNNFNKRKDGRDLTKALAEAGYAVKTDINEIKKVTSGKLAGFTHEEHNPPFEERKDLLPISTQTALTILDKNPKGFFLMVEGSEIDWGGHANNTDYVVGEMLDFDYSVGIALEYAAENKHTLVIITADHETGGMAITGGSYEDGTVKATFSTKGHTGVMVPVFAWGPGSEYFRGIMDNTEIFEKMNALIKR